MREMIERSSASSEMCAPGPAVLGGEEEVLLLEDRGFMKDFVGETHLDG